MRLLDVRDLRVIEVRDDAIPRYAILSHRWEEEEVTYQDLAIQPEYSSPHQEVTHDFGTRPDRQLALQVENKKGFLKLRSAAQRARTDGYNYLWIDTCCIDKTSSAELSEAINSMYRWYQDAGVCYAFLSDVSVSESEPIDMHGLEAMVRESLWFTRGWTLQELVAPKEVQFYSAAWHLLGNKSDDQGSNQRQSLVGSRILSEITGIDEMVLSGALDPQGISVATRMSWAALRQTTRVEDLAYCLLGIFAVNMPLLYGEGSRAFIRLQEAIMRETDDQSIFAWVDLQSEASSDPSILSGLLAASPLHFRYSAGIRPLPPLQSTETMPTTITSQGVHLKIYLRKTQLPTSESPGDHFYAVLDCNKTNRGTERLLAIYLKRLWGNQYARVLFNTVELIEPPGGMLSHSGDGYQAIYVRQKPVNLLPDFMVDGNIEPRFVGSAYPPNQWDSSAWILTSVQTQAGGGIGALTFQYPEGYTDSQDVAVVLGIGSSAGEVSSPWCLVVRWEKGDSLRQIYETTNRMIRERRVPARSTSYCESTIANVREVVRHDRSYFLLQVGYIAEMGSYHLTSIPRLNFFPRREVAGLKETATILRELLRDTFINDSGARSTFDPVFLDTRNIRSASAPLFPPATEELELDLDHMDNLDKPRAKKLVEHCRRGLLKEIQAMGPITSIIEVKTKNFHSFTPLYWAVLGGHARVSKYLLFKGARLLATKDYRTLDSNNEDRTSLSPLHLAALLGREDIASILLEAASIDPRIFRRSLMDLNTIKTPGYGDLPLHLHATSRRFSEPLCRILGSSNLAYAAMEPNELGETPLHRAAATGNLEAIRFFTGVLRNQYNEVEITGSNSKKHSYIMLMKRSNFFDLHYRSPIWHAAASGFTDGIDIMYSALGVRGGFVNEPDDRGVSPIHIACRRGDSRTTQRLIAIGAKMNCPTPLGLTPAHFAALFGHRECLRVLQNRMARLDLPAIGLHGLTPLHLAVIGGHTPCVKALSQPHMDRSRLAYLCFSIEIYGKDATITEWEELEVPLSAAQIAKKKGFREISMWFDELDEKSRVFYALPQLDNVETAGLEDGEVAATSPEHGLMTTNSENGVVTTNPEDEVVKTSPENGVVATGSEDGVVTTSRQDGVVTTNSEDSVVSTSPENGVVATHQEDEVVTTSPENGVVATTPEYGTVTTGPKDGAVAIIQEDEMVTETYLDSRQPLEVESTELEPTRRPSLKLEPIEYDGTRWELDDFGPTIELGSTGMEPIRVGTQWGKLGRQLKRGFRLRRSRKG